jgi:hypothetical protein
MRVLSRAWDLLYAGLYGLLVTIAIAALGELIAVGAGAREDGLVGWGAIILAVAACAGIAAAHAIRRQRRS